MLLHPVPSSRRSDERTTWVRRASRRSIRSALVAAILLAAPSTWAAGAGLTAPQIVTPAEPAYPPEALAAGLEARVVLRLTIDQEGHVVDAEVVEGAGHGFDVAAAAAAGEMRFSPALRGETPIASRILFSHDFRLEAPPRPAPTAAPAGDGEVPLEVVVRRRSEAEELRRSAEAVQVLELEGEHTESADLGEVLARTEGVGVRRGGGLGSGTRFSLAGYTDDQIRFFLDGIPLELAGQPFGISNVPVNLVERVEIYRGVVPIRFGADALGGAVNLVTRREREGTHGFASYQLGSFGTHRVALGGSHLDETSGFFARASAFFDRAENDYTITVEPEDPETSRVLEPTEVDRFHDAYLGAGGGVEIGFADRAWARRLSLQGFLAGLDKELQHNLVMRIPYGDATYGQLNGGLTLRYEHDLGADTTLHALAGYTRDRTHLLDVGTCIYDWEGNCVRPDSTPGEVESRARDQVQETDSVFGRVNLAWEIAPDHALRFSLAPTLVTRSGEERRQLPGERDPLGARRDMLVHVGGLEYEVDLFDDRLENITFVKSYLQVLRSEEPLPGDVFRRQDRDTHGFGFGDALRYRFHDVVQAKTSYELATRLPRPDELFGNGVLVEPNLALEPERSHNFNLGATVDAPTLAGQVRFDVNGFLRLADQLIFLVGDDNGYINRNVEGVRSLGVEAAAGWTSPDGLVAVDANATWVDMRNTAAEGPFARNAGDRLQGRPWLFANLAVRFDVRDTLGSGDLSLAWQSRYVHEFFRNWESDGALEYKDIVPSQLLHAVTATQRVDTDLAALSFGAEVQNLTDAATFDFFGLQRPGRSFHFKTTAEF